MNNRMAINLATSLESRSFGMKDPIYGRKNLIWKTWLLLSPCLVHHALLSLAASILERCLVVKETCNSVLLKINLLMEGCGPIFFLPSMYCESSSSCMINGNICRHALMTHFLATLL